MPPKRPSLLEDPPSASSSDGEEEEETEEVESEEEEESEEEISDPKSSMKKPIIKPDPIPSPAPLRQSSSSDEEESDSDAVSGSDLSPEKPKSSRTSHSVDTNVKPISSKPMDDNPKHKRPATNATPTKSSSAAKRLLETDKADQASKRIKKKVSDAEEIDGHLEETDSKTGDDQKKLFQRLWSDEDEIVILKGMANHVKKGLNPTANMNEFLDFIKKSLHVDVNRSQLNSKIQRLKQKYHNNARRAKHGEMPTFSKPHELKSYLLSKKIWGEKDVNEEEIEAHNVGGDSVITDVKSKSRTTSNGFVSPKSKARTLPEIPLEKTPEVEEGWSLYPFLKESMQFTEDLIMPPPGLGESFLRGGVGLIGTSKAKELEQRWSDLRVQVAKNYFNRMELVREQRKMILNALESSKS